MKQSEIKKLINTEKSLITTKQLFTNVEYEKMLQSIANGIILMFESKYDTKLNVKLRVKVSWNEIPTAFTTGKVIQIDANSEYCKKIKSREERHTIIKGLLLHELLHVMYTNFNLHKRTMDTLINDSVLFPAPKVLKKYQPNIDDMKEYLSSYMNIGLMTKIYSGIDNAIEDGFIETIGIDEVPGYKKALLRKREIFYEMLPSLKEMEKNEPHILTSIINLIMEYAKCSELKIKKSDYKNERVQALLECVGEIDLALSSEVPYERKRHINNIIVMLWPHIKDFLDNNESAEPDEAMSECEMSASAPAPDLDTSAPLSSSKEDTEDEDNSNGDDPLNVSSGTSDDKHEDEGSSSLGNEETEAEKEKRMKKQLSELLKKLEEKAENEDEGSISEEDKEDSGYEAAASDIDRIVNNIAEAKGLEKAEEMYENELNEELKGMPFGAIHKGLDSKIKRISSVSERLKDEYDKIYPSIRKISSALSRQVIRELENRLEDEEERNLYYGRMLDISAVARKEPKCFKNYVKAQEIPQMAVALRIDESGSMSCYDRISYARFAALILYDFCHTLNFPIGIYGDTADCDSSDVIINTYADFNSKDNNDKYRLMDISARSNNRDGYAINYVCEKLLKQEAENKILIVISDGNPAASGYYGPAAEKDMIDTISKYRRKGIIPFAAAIGSDKENIKRIYREGFMDISDMSKLPNILTGLLKRYLK